MNKQVVATFYKFVELENYKEMKDGILTFFKENNIKGTIILSKEGINSTIAGSREGIDRAMSFLKSDPRFHDLKWQESLADSDKRIFYKMKVKLREEIVTLGIPKINPHNGVGTHLEPREWDELLKDPDTIIIDTRNNYEYAIGSFKNAINPETDIFREFPKYVKENLEQYKDKKIAMFCTGGIRCEKATAYMKENGFDQTYHLKDGILNYLSQTKEEDSLWDGDCFVFDNRVSVTHELKEGSFEQCFACRMPLTKEEMESPLYSKGISCPHCYDKTSDLDKSRFQERQNQIEIAKKRGKRLFEEVFN